MTRITNKWCQLKWNLQHFCWNPETLVIFHQKSPDCHWSHLKNGGESHPSIHLSQRWRNCNSRNWRPWVLGKWNCAPSVGTGWNWMIGPGFLLDEQGWKEGLLEFFLCIDVLWFVSKRLRLMRFVLFLKNSFMKASFFQVILKTLRWVRQIQPETFHTSISRRVAT